MNSKDNAPISIVRETVIGFMNKMMEEKLSIEELIRSKSEELKTQHLQGAPAGSISGIEQIGVNFKDLFVELYNNHVYIKLLTASTGAIKEAIYQGFIKQDLIKEEVLAEIRELRKELAKQGEMSIESQKYKDSITTHTESTAELTSRMHQLLEDLQAKNTENENLMIRTQQNEKQVTTMAEQLLHAQTELAELQTAFTSQESDLIQFQNKSQDGVALQEHMLKLENKNRELQNLSDELKRKQATRKSPVAPDNNEFIEELENNLEVARNELFKVKGKLVEKNEELRRTTLELEEISLQKNHLAQYKETAKNSVEEYEKQLEEQKLEAKKTLNQLNKQKSELEKSNKKIKEMTKLQKSESKIIGSYKEQIDKLEEERQQLNVSLSDKEQLNSEITNFKKKLEKAEEAKKKNNMVIETQKSKVKELELLNQELTKEISILNDTINEKEQEKKFSNSQLTKLEGQFKIAKSSLKEQENKIVIDEEVKEAYDANFNYFKTLLGSDAKFRILTIFETMNSEIQLPDISISLGLPNDVVHRSLLELENAKYITLRKDGELVFAKGVKSSKAPFSLKEVLNEL